MKREFFTLTYSDTTLRIVMVTKGKIESVGSMEIPAGVVNNGKIERKKMFAEVLIELKKNTKPKKINSIEVIAAVPEEKVFLKIIEIPKMPMEKIDSAIAWQIESIIPFKQKEIYFNWKLIGSNEDKLILLVAVCERIIVDSLIEAISLAKQKPIIVTFPSAGLANLLGYNQEKLTIIVDLSKTNSISMVVAKNKNVYFSTSRHISDNYQGLETIIRNTIDFYNKKYKSEQIGNVLVFGPPELSNIEKQLQGTISDKIKVGEANDIKIIKNIKQEYISYIDNLGLDLTLEKLSLMPPEIRENTKNETINLQMATIVNYFVLFIVFISISYGALWGFLYYKNIILSNNYSDLQSRQSSINQKKIEDDITKLNQKINTIKSLSFENSIKPSFIESIVGAKDDNISLRELTIGEDKSVIIAGVAKSRNDLILFKDRLNALNIMAPITLPIESLEEKEDVDFELMSSMDVSQPVNTNNTVNASNNTGNTQ